MKIIESINKSKEMKFIRKMTKERTELTTPKHVVPNDNTVHRR